MVTDSLFYGKGKKRMLCPRRQSGVVPRSGCANLNLPRKRQVPGSLCYDKSKKRMLSMSTRADAGSRSVGFCPWVRVRGLDPEEPVAVPA